MNVELPAQDRRRLAAYVKARGVVKAASAIGINRGTISSAMAGLPVQPGTAAIIRMRLDEEEKRK